MNPHILVPGLWFYKDDRKEPFYIGSINNETALLLRKVYNGTDSAHSLFNYLVGISLDENILIESFGMIYSDREGYAQYELYPELKVLRGDNMEVIKPATYLQIEIDGSRRRFTTYLECGESKIYLSEISYVHELQILIYAHTYKFPIITVDKFKP